MLFRSKKQSGSWFDKQRKKKVKENECLSYQMADWLNNTKSLDLNTNELKTLIPLLVLNKTKKGENRELITKIKYISLKLI